MPTAESSFTVQQTHGALLLPGVETLASSAQRGWSSIYASVQREAPFDAGFSAVAVDSQLIVLHLDGPVLIHRRTPQGEASRLITPGGLFIMPGGMDYRVRLGEALLTVHLYLRRALIEEVAADIAPGDPAHVEIPPRFGDHDPLIERLIHGVRDVLRDDDPTATPYVDYLARAIAARLIHAHSAATPGGPGETAPVPVGQLGRAIDFMQAHLEQSIHLSAIAGAAGLSPSHFARRFRAAFGLPPHQYLLRLRIERASRLLRETNSSIADIAFACGFVHQEHLTRLFKRGLGATPAAYRKTLRD